MFATLLVAIVGIAALTAAAQVARDGGRSAAAYGLAGGSTPGDLAFLALNIVLLLTALAAISLAASASFDRLAPGARDRPRRRPARVLLEILGTLWPDAAFLQPLSPFHYLGRSTILGGRGQAADLLVLVAWSCCAGFGLWHFPRRDLAAPS